MRTLLIIALLCPATLMAQIVTSADPQRYAAVNEFSVELEGINLGSRVRAVDIEDLVIQKIPLKRNSRYYRSGPLSPIGIKLEVIKSESNSEISRKENPSSLAFLMNRTRSITAGG